MSYLEDLLSLRGRTAVVTGGSSGIGAAMARALAHAGANVVIIARREPELTAAVEAISAEGGSAAWVSADLGVREQVQNAAAQAAEKFGEPDILVNCAGVNLRPHFGSQDDESWDTTMAVNLDAPFQLGRAYGPGMAARGYGRIINVASQQAFRAFADSGGYGVSKAGLVGLTRSQAEAWGAHGVTSNAVVPGFVPTPLNARMFSDPAASSALAARTLIGRNGSPEDFAGLTVLLASPASEYITGQAIFVDGGFSSH